MISTVRLYLKSHLNLHIGWHKFTKDLEDICLDCFK